MAPAADDGRGPATRRSDAPAGRNRGPRRTARRAARPYRPPCRPPVPRARAARPARGERNRSLGRGGAAARASGLTPKVGPITT